MTTIIEIEDGYLTNTPCDWSNPKKPRALPHPRGLPYEAYLWAAKVRRLKNGKTTRQKFIIPLVALTKRELLKKILAEVQRPGVVLVGTAPRAWSAAVAR